MVRLLLQRRVTSDYQITYVGGSSVRRVARGRRVEWYVNGAPATEAQARERMQTMESMLRS